MDKKQQMAKCVITSVNGKYIPYLSVLIVSIMQNVKKDNEYEIIILHDDLAEDSQKKLLSMVYSNNVGVRFINIHERMAGYSFFINGTNNQSYLSKEAYFRLLAPELLMEYTSVLYLDCDIVVQPGWDNIFDLDLENYLLAGISDIWGNWECYDHNSSLYKYRQTELGISNPLEYFNSGVMMLNLEEMRATFSKGELLETAALKEWRKHDQDVLNRVCRGRVLFLDYSWNLIECPSQKAWKTVTDSERTQYKDCFKKPYIIHYASRKPWIVKGVFWEQEFWKAATKSSYFEILFASFIKEQLRQGEYFEETVFQSIREKKIGIRFIIKCILTWIKTFIMYR